MNGHVSGWHVCDVACCLAQLLHEHGWGTQITVCGKFEDDGRVWPAAPRIPLRGTVRGAHAAADLVAAPYIVPGPLPASFGNFANVQNLDLSGNAFTGKKAWRRGGRVAAGGTAQPPSRLADPGVGAQLGACIPPFPECSVVIQTPATAGPLPSNWSGMANLQMLSVGAPGS